jgi:hypothetical protein
LSQIQIKNVFQLKSFYQTLLKENVANLQIIKKNKIPQALQGSSDISILQFVAYITLFSLQDLAVMF